MFKGKHHPKFMVSSLIQNYWHRFDGQTPTGGSDGITPEKLEELKKSNPNFQDIFDHAIKKGKAEVDTKLKQTKDEHTKLISEYELLKKQYAEGSEQHKTLQAKIDDLEAQVLTKGELAEKRFLTEKKKFESELEKSKKDTDNWKGLFTKNLIDQEIITYASEKAINPKQVLAILERKAIVQNKKNESGQIIPDKFEVLITLDDVPIPDGDGKVETKVLPPSEAINTFLSYNLNLVKTELISGGGTGTPASIITPTKGTIGSPLEGIKTMDEYLKRRKDILK